MGANAVWSLNLFSSFVVVSLRKIEPVVLVAQRGFSLEVFHQSVGLQPPEDEVSEVMVLFDDNEFFMNVPDMVLAHVALEDSRVVLALIHGVDPIFSR